MHPGVQGNGVVGRVDSQRGVGLNSGTVEKPRQQRAKHSFSKRRTMIDSARVLRRVLRRSHNGIMATDGRLPQGGMKTFTSTRGGQLEVVRLDVVHGVEVEEVSVLGGGVRERSRAWVVKEEVPSAFNVLWRRELPERFT